MSFFLCRSSENVHTRLSEHSYIFFLPFIYIQETDTHTCATYYKNPHALYKKRSVYFLLHVTVVPQSLKKVVQAHSFFFKDHFEIDTILKK